MIEARNIIKMLPHRYPFLLVDRVLSHTDDALVAIKNVTVNEPFFPGHFPGEPTMPGVLMLEGMAQACGLLAVIRSGVTADSGLILYFAGIDNARFKRPVIPGDQLRFEVKLVKQKRDLWKFTAEARVGSDLACCADLMCVLRHPDKMQDGA